MSSIVNTGKQTEQWVDRAWEQGRMSGVAGYWMGWGSVCLGLFILGLWLFGTFADRISFGDLFSYIGTLVVGLIFFGFGILGISMARNLANRARVIDFRDDAFRVEFWWRGRRKDIEFGVSDVESVDPCQKEKGIIELLAKLPREPICYHVQVRDQAGFIVTGTDEAIHEIVKRFSSEER